MNEMKICTKCKEEKELSQFGKSNRTKNGLQNHCKKCLSSQAAENKSKRTPNIKPDEGYKTCAKCNVEKHVNDLIAIETGVRPADIVNGDPNWFF